MFFKMLAQSQKLPILKMWDLQIMILQNCAKMVLSKEYEMAFTNFLIITT